MNIDVGYTTCARLSFDAKSASDTYPYLQINNFMISMRQRET